MANRPLITVVIPNYNHCKYLSKRLDSVINQKYTNIEILVLDDASTDQSQQIIEDYVRRDNRITYVCNEINSGSTFKQWNKGVSLARGEYVWFAESDDFADLDFLERMLPYLENHRECVLAFCDSYVVDQTDAIVDMAKGWCGVHGLGQPLDKDCIVDGKMLSRDFFTRKTVIPNASAVLFRKSVYEKVGLADESLQMTGDWKLWFQMALTGSVAYHDEPLNYFRTHPDNVRTRRWGILRSEAMALQTFFHDELSKSSLDLKSFYCNWFDWCFREIAWQSTPYRFSFNNIRTFFKYISPATIGLFAKRAIQECRRKVMKRFQAPHA